MNRGRDVFIWIIGSSMLLVAGFTFLLFIANLRSRIYYHEPDYSFLIWVFLYFLITGIGILRLRKWGVVMLFVPAASYLLILLFGFRVLIHSFALSWVLPNALAFAVFVGVPAAIVRRWKELCWRI